MKITMKRLASLAMAGALALSISAPAFAATTGTMTNPTAGKSTRITATYEEATVDVLVPATATAIINPLGIGYDVAKSDSTKASFTGQICTVPMAIYNKSALDVKVGATASATINQSTIPMRLATETTKGHGSEGDDDYVAPQTSKSAFVQLEVASAPTGISSAITSATGENDSTLNDAIITESAKSATWGSVAAGKKLTLGTRAVTVEDMVTLGKATMNATTGVFDKFGATGIALFRLTGDCVENPNGGWIKANATASPAVVGDGFVADITFSFKPVVS